jgi:16S rRNA (cytosine1402-N4)-methyltransferase
MGTNDNDHVPVLVREVLQGLSIRPEGIYIDCTFGRGGHSSAILEQLGKKGKLFVFDKDPDAIEVAQQLSSTDNRVQCFHSAFSNIINCLKEFELLGTIDGILFDLGISSPQINMPERGFSFNLDGNLDMRRDTTTGMSASTWINRATVEEITHVLKVYGEEKFSRRIARAIDEARVEQPISTTHELSRIIISAIPVHDKNKHPATRTFQAIRIYLNNELDELAKGLIQAFDLLQTNGKLVVISFHSLEDRIVKRFMREYSKNDPYPNEIPVTIDMIKPRLKILGKAIKPCKSEIMSNPRARSARLRIAEKLQA